ncbi:MAG: aspartate kinase [Bacteroidetes bacterium]|jgi:aspartate kinase|nr:aspartate kinase [Bacteroidota bacterium]MBS1926180.1 aspartate kinase [Bacteroidota bacterium]MCC6693650.1 aspartate kinase [Chitinophagaceae bacterium]HMU23696.1 aspartate kinase [Ferruginibacter sp.]
MKVFKFGGASINSIDRIKSTSQIIKTQAGDKLLLVVSAMGKTTNALEKVAGSFFEGKKEEALALFQQVKDQHRNTLKYLTVTRGLQGENQLNDFNTEVEWLLHDKPVRQFDYYYDQVVCSGELMSTAILYHYLLELGVNIAWVDVRDVIKTDNNFRDAGVDWDFTGSMIKEKVLPLFEQYDVVLTQGFIGSTFENESTTLGREGSDYTAAIFANLMNAESVTIWKDVESVMNADPRKFADAVNIYSLSYAEVIEMAYYGAQVIHPKTIKPLQNKNIPLFVKNFLNPQLQGTSITHQLARQLPTLIVVKENQALMQFKSKDFSFVEDKPIEQLHKIFDTVKLKPNLSQNTAISLLCSFDDRKEKIDQLAHLASEFFDVELERNLSLLTLRHYNTEIYQQLTKGKTVVLLQKTPETVQALMRENTAV